MQWFYVIFDSTMGRDLGKKIVDFFGRIEDEKKILLRFCDI